jgi:hypothetical protein
MSVVGMNCKVALGAVALVFLAFVLAGCVSAPECSADKPCPFKCSGLGGSPQNCVDGKCAVMESFSPCLKECGASCTNDSECAQDQTCDLGECKCTGETTEPTLGFYARECGGDIDPYTTKTGINGTRWLDDATLEVKAIAILNCAEKVQVGSYKLSGTTLTLYYEYKPCTVCTLCVCGQEMTYTLTNIPKKDYRIELEASEKTGGCETNEDCKTDCFSGLEVVPKCISGECELVDMENAKCSKKCGAACENDNDCSGGRSCDQRECICINEATQGVGLKTDKYEYRLGETVRVTVSNPTSATVCYFAYGGSNCNRTPFNVSWFFGDSWQTFTTLQPGVLCSGDTEPFHCIDVPAGGSKTVSWSQTFYKSYENEPFKQAPNGKYKISMEYRSGSGEWKTIESNEFNINY